MIGTRCRTQGCRLRAGSEGWCVFHAKNRRASVREPLEAVGAELCGKPKRKGCAGDVCRVKKPCKYHAGVPELPEYLR